MDITPEMRAIINGLPGANPPPAAPEGGGFGRVLKNIANAPINFLEGTAQGLVSAGQMFTPGPADKVSFPKFFDIPEAQTTGDVVGDFFVGKHGLVDTMAQILAPAGVLGRVGKGLGMAEGKALDAARFFGGEALAQAGIHDSSGADIGVAGAVGGLQAPLAYLPMSARLPLSGLLAGAHGAYEAHERGGVAGGVTAAADFFSGLIGLPGTKAQPVEGPITTGPLSTQNPETLSTTPGGRLRRGSPGAPTGPQPGGGLIQLPQTIVPNMRPNGDGGLIRMAPEPPVSKPQVEVAATTQRMVQANATHGYAPTSSVIRNMPPPPPVGPPEGALMGIPSAPQMVDLRESGGIMRMPQTTPPRIATLQNAPSPTGSTVTPSLRPLATEQQLPPRPNPPAEVPVEAPPVKPKDPFLEALGKATKLEEQLQYLADRADSMRKMRGITQKTWKAHNAEYTRLRSEYEKAWADFELVRAERNAVTAKPVEPIKPEQKIKWTAQEQAFAKDLSTRYSKLSEKDLKEDIFDLDNDIANAPDEASARSYRLARETAQNVLDSRSAPAEIVQAQAAQAAPKLKLRRNQEIGYKGEMGDVERATLVDFDHKARIATIRFAGSPREISVPYARLQTDKLPEKVATLQKLDSDEIESINIRDNLEAVDEKMQRVDESEIQRMEERTPGKVRENIAPEDLHSGRYATGTGTGVSIDAKVTPEVMEKLQQVIDEVIFKTNRNTEVSFKTGMNPKRIAQNVEFGSIEVNAEVMAKWFKDWPSMSATQRGVVLTEFAQVIGHEVGHSALLWLRATDPKAYKDLTIEFKNMSEESRRDILEKFYRMIGKDPSKANIDYMTGSQSGILSGYPFLHQKVGWAVEEAGMEEFFAEMFSAHTLGLLNEKLLPKEMASVWKKIKDIFIKLVSLFSPKSYDEAADAEEIASLQVFRTMLEDIAHGFRQSSGDAHFRLMGKGSAIRDAEYTRSVRESKKFHDQDIATKYKEKEKLRAKEKKEVDQYIENHDYISFENSETIEYGYKGAWWTPTPGIKAAFTRELTQELGAAVAGGILGGVSGPGLTDGNISMAEGILMGGVLGAFGPRAIKALLAVPKSTGSTFHHKTFAESLAAVFKGDVESVAADAATGHGSSVAKFFRSLERNFNLHLPEQLFNAVVEADGAAAWALHTVDDAFKKVKNFKVSPAMETATENYLKGGTLANYRSLVAGLSSTDQRAADFYVAAREAIATLQTHFAVGLPDGTLKSQILDSLSKGDYLTRQYRIFHDPKYRPTQAQIESVAMKYATDHPAITLDAARSIIENYIHEIKVAGTDFRGSVTDVGKKLDAYLWKNRQNLDASFRDMLGEYHDPREKVLGTIHHLYTSAITGRLINTVTTLKDKLGLNFAYGMDEHSLEIERLQAAISRGHIPPGETIATLQNKLNTLTAYVPLDNNTRYGKLSNKMVSRFVRDQLATFDSPWGLLDGTIMRTMAKFHNYVKIARAPLNPITVVRNIIAMPILTAIGGANPLTDIRKAYKLIKANGPEVKEMLENGILNVDSIRGEMLRNVDYVRMLDVDESITGLVKKGVNKALDFYRWPDMLVRGATYVSAKAKFAKELGLPDTDAAVIAKARDWTNRYTVNYANVAPIVKTMRQIPFTNLFISYTAEITRIVKNLVQDAFKHENPGQRVRAAGLLGGLAAIPFSMEKFATSQLSEKDRKDWEKARSLMPDYLRTKHLIVTGREPNGRFRYFDMTPVIQIDAFTQMGRAIATGDMQAVAAVNPIVSWENTPALNIVAEQLTGEDMRTGRPIDKNILTRARAVLDDVVPPILPGGYEFRRWSEATSQTQSGELGITNARTGRRTTPGEIVASYLTGMRFGTVDASKLHQFAVADAKRKIADEQAYLRDVVKTDLPAATKQKAIDRYNQTARAILLELTQKIRPQ